MESVYYFAEADIPVARRHALQKWAAETHGVELEILDGQALAEALTSPDLFWIAEQYLSVSAEHYPQADNNDDARYAEYRTKWFGGTVAPSSYSDFFEIKYGLRKATFSTPQKPDLTSWVRVIEAFLDPTMSARLRRRARYEICVAVLRGQNNLDAKAELVVEYFATLTGLDAQELTDATTLLTYCSFAQVKGRFQIDPARLHEWTSTLSGEVMDVLRHAAGPDTRCLALQTIGHVSLLPFRKGVAPQYDMKDTFRYWSMLVKEVNRSPMFPLESFADVLTIMTPVVGKNARFLAITSRVDVLLSKRTGGFIAAEKCRDRAIQHLESGQYLSAIKLLHTSRKQWFTAETLHGSVLSMLMLANCYLDIGLCFAGAHYALGAALVSFRSDDDRIKHLFPRAVFLAADCYYAAGATVTYLTLLRGALFAHWEYGKNSSDLHTPDLMQNMFAHCAIMRSIAERLQPNLVPVIDAQIAQWPINEDVKRDIREWSTKSDIWTKTVSTDELWRRAQQDLVDRPFSDAGAARKIQWKALGFTWVIEHANTFRRYAYWRRIRGNPSDHYC